VNLSDNTLSSSVLEGTPEEVDAEETNQELNQELGFVSCSDSNGFNTLCEVLDADPDKDNPNVFPVELRPDVARFWPRRRRGIGATVRVVFRAVR
jgi:hypothetical protein